jgi:hypothetical protein
MSQTFAKLSAAVRALLPKTVEEAKSALAALVRDIDKAKTYEGLRTMERRADAIKAFYSHIDEVKHEAERAVLLVRHRAGEVLRDQPAATGTRGMGRPSLGVAQRATPKTNQATMKEMVGSQDRGSRLKQLAQIPRTLLDQTIKKLHDRGKDATQTAVMKAVAGDETKERRERSRAATPIPDGMDLRIGDCRKVLADIAPNSVTLILTDPPYGDEVEPLYRWLAQWASRVLIPGGSMICYTGQSRPNRDIAIFDERLRYWWLLVMPHDQSQRLAGKFVIANFKPVLWYVKEHRCGRTLVPDFLKSPARDKSAHGWSQGDAGIAPLVEHLTEPGELIVDPFAGTGNWGRAALSMGRRWIGADIAKGGTESVSVAAE